jgi:hypothetical protein
MAVATLEDLQGALEVVVFPRMYATSGGTFAEGSILLVAGRIDHRGEEASVLADAAWVWEDAVSRGPTAIAQEVAAGDRPRGNRRWGSGAPAGQSAPPTSPAAGTVSVPVTAGPPPAPKVRVSPLRGGGVTVLQPGSAAVPAAPPAPISAAPAPDDLATFAPDREEPPLPDEAQAAAARSSAAPTQPLEATASAMLNVRFTRGAETARIVMAMEELRAVFKERPGATRVIFHIPGDRGATSPMEVRSGVAYDAELLAEVRRRLGEGLVHLEVSSLP